MKMIMLLAFTLITGCGCIQKVIPDDSPLAIFSNDMTAIIEGCGNQPIVGYTYCRVREGSAINKKIDLIVPPTECKREVCAFYKVYFPDGSLNFGGGIPKKTTRVSIPWKKLLNRDDFVSGDRGMWGVRLEWYWISKNDDREYRTISDGEIRLRVYPSDYVPLNNIKDHKAFAWTWKDNNHIYRVTTSGRSYVGKL